MKSLECKSEISENRLRVGEEIETIQKLLAGSRTKEAAKLSVEARERGMAYVDAFEAFIADSKDEAKAKASLLAMRAWSDCYHRVDDFFDAGEDAVLLLESEYGSFEAGKRALQAKELAKKAKEDKGIEKGALTRLLEEIEALDERTFMDTAAMLIDEGRLPLKGKMAKRLALRGGGRDAR